MAVRVGELEVGDLFFYVARDGELEVGEVIGSGQAEVSKRNVVIFRCEDNTTDELLWNAMVTTD